MVQIQIVEKADGLQHVLDQTKARPLLTVQDRQKLDHVEPALAALVLGDVRLRLPK